MPLSTQMLYIISSQQIKTSQMYSRGNVGYEGWHVHLSLEVDDQVKEGEAWDNDITTILISSNNAFIQ